MTTEAKWLFIDGPTLVHTCTKPNDTVDGNCVDKIKGEYRCSECLALCPAEMITQGLLLPVGNSNFGWFDD